MKEIAIGFMSTTETARQLGISEPTVRRWCNMGRLTALKVGRAWVVIVINGEFVSPWWRRA